MGGNTRNVGLALNEKSKTGSVTVENDIEPKYGTASISGDMTMRSTPWYRSLVTCPRRRQRVWMDMATIDRSVQDLIHAMNASGGTCPNATQGSTV